MMMTKAVEVGWTMDSSIYLKLEGYGAFVLFSQSDALDLVAKLQACLANRLPIGALNFPVKLDETMPTNEIHVIGTNGKKVVIKF